MTTRPERARRYRGEPFRVRNLVRGRCSRASCSFLEYGVKEPLKLFLLTLPE